MKSLSENSKLRKYYLKEQKVPTQSVIRKTMSDKLADVLFKSLNPEVKVLAGLEPPLKGAGNDWFMCPKENLNKSRAVMKPIDHKLLAKLHYTGIQELGTQAYVAHHLASNKEKDRIVHEADMAWRTKIELAMNEYWNENVQICEKYNTEKMLHMFHLFADIYQKSFRKIEKVFHEAIKLDTEKVQIGAQNRMKKRYSTFLKNQAIHLTEEYDNKINEEKARLKAEFIENVENSRTDMIQQIHDFNKDKHEFYERLRKVLECEKISCQLYVLLKEKEDCLNEMEEMKCKHEEHVQLLTEQSKLQDVEIRLVEQKEKQQAELNSIWANKVRHVVRNFQKVINYCLHILPNQADFFINMEKLMLLQLSEVLENPTADNIFEPEKPQFNTPVPQAKPFYLVCDKGYKAKVDQDLCPKQSGTSSVSVLPAVIINRRCLYAACDNFAQFTERIKDYIFGDRGHDADVQDDIDYELFVPVKYTQMQQLLELKLESSIMHMLQNELSSGTYNVSNTFSASIENADSLTGENEGDINEASVASTSEKKDTPLSKIRQTEHEREPKLKSYFKYMSPQNCECIKKPIVQQIPPYMRNMSEYETLELPNYEKCSVASLKNMVKRARKKQNKSSQRSLTTATSNVKDASTQYIDEEFNYLCQCLSQRNIDTSNLLPVSQVDDGSHSYSSSPILYALGKGYSRNDLIECTPSHNKKQL